MVGKEVDSPARKNAAILNGVASTRGQSCQCGDFTCAKRKSAADSKCRGILSDGTSCENGLNSTCMSMHLEWQCLTCRTLQLSVESAASDQATPALPMEVPLPPSTITGADSPVAHSMSSTVRQTGSTDSTVASGVPIKWLNDKKSAIEVQFCRRGQTVTRTYRKREFSNEQLKSCSKYLFVEEDKTTSRPKPIDQVYWYVMGDAYFS